MRTRNSYFPNRSSATIPRRRNKRRTSNVVEPELRTIVEMADNRTMEELLQAPTEGYGEAIVISEINANHFETKTNLLQLVQANPYHGFDRENSHTHINNFQWITLTLKFMDVPNDVIKLMMFPYSLEGNARIWENASKSDDRIDKPANQISTLVDIFVKKIVIPAPVKAVEESCVTCGGAHAYYNCPNTKSNQPSVCVATDLIRIKDKDITLIEEIIFNLLKFQIKDFKTNLFKFLTIQFNKNQSSTLGTLLSNTIPNPKGEMKAITTHIGVAYEGPLIPIPKKVVERETEETTGMDVCHALADLDVSINLMPLSIWKKLSLPKLTPTRMTLELADKSIARTKGLVEDIFVEVGKFHFLTDFVVVNFEADPRVSLILRRSFLRTSRTLVDIYGAEITLWVNDEAVIFILNQNTIYSSTYDDFLVNRIDIIDVDREEYAQEILGFSNNSSGGNPTSTFEPIFSDSSPSLTPFEGSDSILEEIDAYLKDEAIAWKIIDIKGIDPRFYTHKILMEKDYKPAVQSQRRVNPKIHEAIKIEVIKILDAGMIYPIFDNPWVSPIHCVPKKGGITVVENENNELIPTWLVTGIDYRKLNDATHKDYFLFPFMDQMKIPLSPVPMEHFVVNKMHKKFALLLKKKKPPVKDRWHLHKDSAPCLAHDSSSNYNATTRKDDEQSGRTVTITTEDMQRKKNDVNQELLYCYRFLMSTKVEKDDLNQKFLTSLAPEWLMQTIVWRNRNDLDTMSLDDLYNHLKVYEAEVQKKSNSNSQDMAFISSSKNSSNEDGNIA
nr:reverse transcriptase domain-containing protein [Tanacetum cinerariifolium]